MEKVEKDWAQRSLLSGIAAILLTFVAGQMAMLGILVLMSAIGFGIYSGVVAIKRGSRVSIAMIGIVLCLMPVVVIILFFTGKIGMSSY